MPLAEFGPRHRQEIFAAVERPTPPNKWIRVAGARLPNRAWWEWHWARGRRLWPDPNAVATGQRKKLPRSIRLRVIERDGYICGLCLGPVEPADVHIDHIHPVSLGGGNELENLQVAHSLCNIRKGARV
jgi:5-methylcytosine-specific restriction endonuclease McrA